MYGYALLATFLGSATFAFAAPPMYDLDPRQTSTCVDSSANGTDIQLALYYGGEGTVVSLCPGATIPLYDTIYFTAPYQEVSTQGYPKGSTRATLVVQGENLATAFMMSCGWNCLGVALRNIQINGNRPGLGRLDGAAALIGASASCLRCGAALIG